MDLNNIVEHNEIITALNINLFTPDTCIILFYLPILCELRKLNEIGGRWWLMIGEGCISNFELLEWGKPWEILRPNFKPELDECGRGFELFQNGNFMFS